MNSVILINKYHTIISLIYNNIYKFKKIYYDKDSKNKNIKKFLYNLKYSKIKIIAKNKFFFKSKKNKKKKIIIGLLMYKKLLYDVQYLILNKLKIFMIYLENLMDVNNLTYCVRNSNASGVDCILFSSSKNKKLNYNFIKNSSGSITPIIYINNIKNFFKKLKKLEFIIICTKESSNVSLYEVNFKKNIVFIFGSENKGIKNNTLLNICDYNIYIPMKGNINSLNVSSSCALCLYEILRRKYY